jgi:tetratricopeptide (TPR) repeat protein
LPVRTTLKAAVAALALIGMVSTAVAAKKEEAKPEPTDACGPRKFTKKFDKPMGEAQKAYDTKDWATVLAKVSEAEAVPVEKTVFDQFMMHEFRAMAYLGTKQNAQALPEFQASYDSPCMDSAIKSQRDKVLVQLAYQVKDYPKAIELGKRALATNPDPNIGVLVANSYYITEDYANTKLASMEVVKLKEVGGKAADEDTYRILESACVRLKDEPCVAEQIEKLVLHYPKPDYWADLTNSLLRGSTNDKELLNILRLADRAGALNGTPQYIELSQLAIASGLPGEAQSIIEKGFQKDVFKDKKDKDLATRILADAKQAATYDKTTLDKQDASARAKPAGDSDIKLGAAYLSYGQNEKAVEALTRGIGKGTLKDPDEAGLLLGMAYLRVNNTAEATKAFESVAKNPVLARIAKLWILTTREPGTAG